MSKIFFTDLDGTLLDDRKQVSAENRKAIEDLISAGHKIVLTTGRPLPSAIHQAELLDLTFEGCYLIAFNGAQIYDSYRKKILFQSRLPLDAVRRIFALCEENHIHVQTYDDHSVITRHVTEELTRYCRDIICEYKVVEDVTQTLGEGPPKILLLHYKNPKLLQTMREKILSAEGHIVDAFFSGPALLEVVLKGTDKGVAVKKLCEILETPLENSVAAGDGMNDIPLLMTAHIGAAMKNATKEARAVADYITTRDNNASGAAEIIRRFLLEEPLV